MKNKNLVQKIVLIALAIAVLIALVAPAIFSQSLPAPKQEKLLNGLKVLMWSDARADKAAVAIRIHAGSAFDPQGKEGVMQMLADNLFPNEAAREFFTEDLGGGLEIITNYDFIQINASAKPDQFLPMLETLSAAVSNMAIDKETTAKLRDARLAKLVELESSPAYIADRAVAERLFGTFPYGRPQYGTRDSLKKIDFADLIDARQRFLTADNATIAVTGNFDRALAFRAIRRFFGGWLKADKRVPATFRQPDEPATDILRIPSPKPGVALIRLATRGAARSDKTFPASLVFARIMENRLRPLLPAEDPGTGFVRSDSYALPGSITVGFHVGPNYSAKESGRIIGFDLSTPVTQSEFQTAQNAVLTQWNKRDVASFWLDADTYKVSDLGQYARAPETLTLSDVTAYAEKLSKQPVVIVLVSPSAGTH